MGRKKESRKEGVFRRGEEERIEKKELRESGIWEAEGKKKDVGAEEVGKRRTKGENGKGERKKGG